jgi:hypothetical protein
MPESFFFPFFSFGFCCETISALFAERVFAVAEWVQSALDHRAVAHLGENAAAAFNAMRANRAGPVVYFALVTLDNGVVIDPWCIAVAGIRCRRWRYVRLDRDDAPRR